MAKKKAASPTLTLQITKELRERAIKSNSGGCLVADAIKEQYPQFSAVSVDMATIRFSDRKAGRRYTYLSPASAQHALLSFDQGWPLGINEVVLRRAVKINAILNSADREAKKQERLAELEAKVARGEQLTRTEKAALTKLRNSPDRPAAQGRAEVSGSGNTLVVVGGEPLHQGKGHPNLLRGRNRHFGAKLAHPGEAFDAAVDEAVAQRVAEIANEHDPGTVE